MTISKQDEDKLKTIVTRLNDEIEMLEEVDSTRSTAIAKTYLQTALMWLNRALWQEGEND